MVPPSRHTRQVPLDLETICLKCLEKEPRRRYGSALALADDLRRYLAGESIAARPLTGSQRFWRWCRRRPLVASLLGLLLMLAVGSVVGLATLGLALKGKNDELTGTNAELKGINSALEKKKAELTDANKKITDNLDALKKAKTKAEEAAIAAKNAESKARENEKIAKEQRDRADDNLAQFQTVVSEFYFAVCMDNRIGDELRKNLLDKARVYYLKFIDQKQE